MRGWLIKVINMSFTSCCLCVLSYCISTCWYDPLLSLYIEDNDQILVEDRKD